MITIKTTEEIEKMRIAGKINYECHQMLGKAIKPGITTKELDYLAAEFIKSKGCKASFLGYQGYPASINTSVNESVVHEIPSKRILQNGDIISIDIGVIYEGYHSDSAWTHPVGVIDKKKQKLLDVTKEALYAGMNEIKNGVRLGNISAKIESVAKKNGYGVVRELVGHGVGKNLHEDPEVPNYGKYGTGPILKTGMTLAIEPMFTEKSPKIWILDDDWTIETRDGSMAAHYEHTIVVTDEGYTILTGE